MKGLNVIKNVFWAFGILVCLVAVAGGLIFGAFTKYSLPEGYEMGMEQEEQNAAVGSGILHQLPESADGGQSYLDSLTFLCDSAMIGLRDYGLITDVGKVWGSSAGNISVENIADPTIRYSDGTERTVSQAAEAAKPSVLVISLGMDSLQKIKQADFEANYTALINNIRTASPETKIVVCSLSSVTSGYSSPDGITIEMVSEAETWIQNVCRSTGVFYADAASAVKDTSNTLLSDYAGVNNKALNSAGINKILEYLRGHIVS